MLEALKKEVFEQNLKLVEYGLVVLTWGNVSAIDRESGLFVIKPSGVPYSEMTAEDMVVMDLEGNKVEGKLNPSSDTPTHMELYRNFKDIGGVVHTHSSWGCSWAQTGRDVPAYGTTHADFANGAVPCTRGLTKEEVESAYELNTGKVENALILEEVCKMAYRTESIAALNTDSNIGIEDYLLKKHYERKHGKDAYYGQKQ